MILSLDETKQFLKIEQDFIEEDNFINSLIIAAESYIINATGKTFDSSNKLAVLAAQLLVSNWYDNRAITTNSNQSKLSLSLDCIITQLTYCGDDAI